MIRKMPIIVVLLLASIIIPHEAAFSYQDQKFSPDLVIIQGFSYQKFLSVIPSVSKINSLPPVIFFEKDHLSEVENIVNLLNPQKVLILGKENVFPSPLKKLCQFRETVYLFGNDIQTSTSLAERQWKTSYQVILAPDKNYKLALVSSPLAAYYQCPLLFYKDRYIPELTLKALTRLNPKEIIIAGKPDKELKKQLKILKAKIIFIPQASSLISLYLKTTSTPLAVKNLIVTNPEDINASALSLLAAPLSIIHHAPILFVSSPPEKITADEIEEKIRGFEEENQLALKYLTLVGDEIYLPPKSIPDPVCSNKQVHSDEEMYFDEEEHYESSEIQVEIGSYVSVGEPLSLAVGRITAENVYDGAIFLTHAISYHRLRTKSSGNVLMLSNADETLDLCEIISQLTVKEFKNWQLPISAYYGQDINKELLKKKLPEKDVIISEGHHWDMMTLFEEEPVYFFPYLFFAQSCDSLNKEYAYPLFKGGTLAYIGSGSSIHSASGAAFAKAFFDAILYEDMDMGSALLYAKNYLLTWINLKKKRGHLEWAKVYRVALSFALWSDPTTKLYLRTSSKPKLIPTKIKRLDNQLLLITSPAKYKKVETKKYYSKCPPYAKVSGVVKKKEGMGKRRVPAFLFANINLNDASQLKLETSDLKEEEWAYTWDEKGKMLYLLVYPKPLKKGAVFAFTIKK